MIDITWKIKLKLESNNISNKLFFIPRLNIEKQLINLLIIMMNAGTGSRLFFRQFSKWSFPSPPLDIMNILTRTRGMLHTRNMRTIPIRMKKDFSLMFLKYLMDSCFTWTVEPLDVNLSKILVLAVADVSPKSFVEQDLSNFSVNSWSRRKYGQR